MGVVLASAGASDDGWLDEDIANSDNPLVTRDWRVLQRAFYDDSGECAGETTGELT